MTPGYFWREYYFKKDRIYCAFIYVHFMWKLRTRRDFTDGQSGRRESVEKNVSGILGQRRKLKKKFEWMSVTAFVCLFLSVHVLGINLKIVNIFKR